MNQRIESPTLPRAITAHEALLFDIAGRLQAMAKTVLEAATMSPVDRADALGLLLDEHDKERARIDTARDQAWQADALEAEEDCERRFAREDGLRAHVNDPRDGR